MKAVLHTAEMLPWAEPLGLPWPLLPMGNRPWIEYWIEWCVEQGVREIRIVLGHGAYEIEQYLGDGARWGVEITYSFLRNACDPDSFLRRNPEQWRGGLIYLRRPCFPRRRSTPQRRAERGSAEHAALHADDVLCLHSPSGAALDTLLAYRRVFADPFPADAIAPEPINSLQDYFSLNMALVRGEIAHYLTPGYARQENAYLGFNVVYPPSAELKPPLIVGNDCRIRALASVGPNVVMGSRIIVDRQATVRNSIILDGTYLGAGVEIDQRIVSGQRLIDPSDGTVLELDEIHLLAPLGRSPTKRPLLRRAIHRLLAFALLVALFAPWFVGLLLGLAFASRYRWQRMVGRSATILLPVWTTRSGTPGVFHQLGLDVWPWLAWVVAGRLWLCGQLPCPASEAAEAESWPMYLPGVFGLADLRSHRDDVLQRRLEARYYAAQPGVASDLSLLLRAFAGRWSGRTRDLRNRPGVAP